MSGPVGHQEGAWVGWVGARRWGCVCRGVGVRGVGVRACARAYVCLYV